MPLDLPQAQAINYLSRKPVSVFNYPHSKEMFPNGQPSPGTALYHSHPAISSTSRAQHLLPLLRELHRAVRSWPPPDWTIQVSSSQDVCSRPVISFVALFQMLSSILTCFLYCGAQNSMQQSRRDCTNAKCSGRITCFEQKRRKQSWETDFIRGNCARCQKESFLRSHGTIHVPYWRNHCTDKGGRHENKDLTENRCFLVCSYFPYELR